MVPFANKKELRQLAIAYLFLSADHRMSDADYSVFEELVASSDKKGEIIGECEKLLGQEGSTKSHYEIISDAFEAYVDPYKEINECDVSLLSSSNILSGFEENRSHLWMLISLLYQPGIYSESREKLVAVWLEKSKISESVYTEMCDATKTLDVIKEHKEWLETTNGLPHEYVNSMQAELDKNLKDIQTSVSSLITLG
jgi:hypothetical protein